MAIGAKACSSRYCNIRQFSNFTIFELLSFSMKFEKSKSTILAFKFLNDTKMNFYFEKYGSPSLLPTCPTAYLCTNAYHVSEKYTYHNTISQTDGLTCCLLRNLPSVYKLAATGAAANKKRHSSSTVQRSSHHRVTESISSREPVLHNTTVIATILCSRLAQPAVYGTRRDSNTATRKGSAPRVQKLLEMRIYVRV